VSFDPLLSAEPYCYLTTTGRKSGEPREIEIWFGLHGASLYLMSGGRDRSHWVRNMREDPAVTVRVGDLTLAGRSREVVAESEEDALVREMLVAKYNPGYERDLTDWGRTSLPIAIEFAGAAGS
jgi:deazaflavin-dependent oxidoreductase (nitroreductase family)